MAAHVIVIGNEKGGSGKSTAAMHLIVALLRLGRTVASIDVDARQRSLSRYIENRRRYALLGERSLPMPTHEAFDGDTDANDPAEEGRLEARLRRLAADHDAVVIDTPGTASRLNRYAHACADTLVTPVNDSFIDLDVLARLDSETMRVMWPSHYAEMVWETRKKRAARDRGSVDWIIMRNRLSSLDAHNKRRVGEVLGELSKRYGFRQVPGFGERVIYRELFPSGLTLLDLGANETGESLTLSHVAARQEVRSLVEALRVPAAGSSLDRPQTAPISEGEPLVQET